MENMTLIDLINMLGKATVDGKLEWLKTKFNGMEAQIPGEIGGRPWIQYNLDSCRDKGFYLKFQAGAYFPWCKHVKATLSGSWLTDSRVLKPKLLETGLDSYKDATQVFGHELTFYQRRVGRAECSAMNALLNVVARSYSTWQMKAVDPSWLVFAVPQPEFVLVEDEEIPF